MAGNPEEGTIAVDEIFYETTFIHNRLFQQYAITNQSYLAPIDQDEIERLQIENAVLDRIFDNHLVFPPLNRLRRVLDCGFGTAGWAYQVAEQNPACQVIGLDITASMQPEEQLDNLYLQIADLNSRIEFPAHNFDLVHSQMMATGIHVTRWTNYLRDIFRIIRGGGWLQMVELYYNVQSDNGSLSEGHALCQWSQSYLDSMEGLKDLRAPLRLPDLMRDAGFVDVEQKMIQLPTCGWSTDQREYDIGVANRENVQRMLSSLAIYPFTERLGMSYQDVQLLIAQARVEADEPAFKVSYPSLWWRPKRKASRHFSLHAPSIRTPAYSNPRPISHYMFVLVVGREVPPAAHSRKPFAYIGVEVDLVSFLKDLHVHI